MGPAQVEERLTRDRPQQVPRDGGRVRVRLFRPPRLVVDDREHDPARVHVQPDAAHLGARREARPLDGEAAPRRAAVVAGPDRRARPGLAEVPRPALARPRAGIQPRRVAGVADEVDGAGLVVHEQRPLPGRAAVRRAVDAALGVGRVEVTDGRDRRHVRVGWVEEDATDVVRLLQPEVRPRRAAVGAPVDARAGVRRPRRVGLAGAHPQRRPVALRVRPVDRHVADGEGRHLVEERREAGAAVARHPHPAGGVGDDEGGRVADLPLDVRHAPAHHGRADRPERDLGDRRPLGQSGSLHGRIEADGGGGRLGDGLGKDGGGEQARQGEEAAHRSDG